MDVKVPATIRDVFRARVRRRTRARVMIRLNRQERWEKNTQFRSFSSSFASCMLSRRNCVQCFVGDSTAHFAFHANPPTPTRADDSFQSSL